MKYDIDIEVLQPTRHRATVEVPDDIDDPAEYLREHPVLWTDRRVPEDRQQIARIRPAAPPEPLDPDLLLILHWTTTVNHRHQAALTVAELRQALTADTTGQMPPWHTVLDAVHAMLDNLDSTGLETLLTGLERDGLTEATVEEINRYPSRELLADQTGARRLRALRPEPPEVEHRQVVFAFTETSHGHGRVDLADLEHAGAWKPGTPVTGAVLDEYFGTSGADRGRLDGTDHDYQQIAYTSPDDSEGHR